MYKLNERNNLNKYCNLKNIKHRELAEKIGVSHEYIHMISTGDRVPALAIAQKIANELETTIEKIFF